MTDTVKSWIEERRTIHTGGRDVLLRSSYELERESGIEEGADIDAIVDAHNSLPRALDALSKVLELHKPDQADPKDWMGRDRVQYCEHCEANDAHTGEPLSVPWPCATVQAIEGAINE